MLFAKIVNPIPNTGVETIFPWKLIGKTMTILKQSKPYHSPRPFINVEAFTSPAFFAIYFMKRLYFQTSDKRL
jgi:hypothetical protein